MAYTYRLAASRVLPAGGMLAAYVFLLILLVNARPFWLDEAIQLSVTGQKNVSQVIEKVRENPGAVPLGYLSQSGCLAVMHLSRFSARFPSLVFAALGLITLLTLARAVGCRLPWIAGLLWIVIPLELRYALEARPYVQACAFTVLALWCLFKVLDRPAAKYAFGLALALAACLYTQPFAALPVLGAALWLLVTPAARKAGLYALAASAAAAVVFLPWLFTSAAAWHAQAVSQGAFVIRPRLAILIVREISGDGYLCSVPLLILTCVGCASMRIKPLVRRSLVAGIILAIGVALLSDAVFQYFFAIRQIVFVLPLMFVLAAEGVRVLAERRLLWLSIGLCGLMFAAAIDKNVRYFSDRSEDWQAATTALTAAAATPSSCIAYPEEQPAEFYAAFDRTLAARRCRTFAAERIVVPTTRYTKPDRLADLRAELERRGYVSGEVNSAGGTRIDVFGRR